MINKQLQKDKAVSVSAIMNNSKLFSVVSEGLNSPPGSSKRQKAAAILRTFNKRRMDGKGGGYDLMPTNPLSKPNIQQPQSRANVQTPTIPKPTVPNPPASVIDLPKQGGTVSIGEMDNYGKVIFPAAPKMSSNNNLGVSSAYQSDINAPQISQPTSINQTTPEFNSGAYYEEWYNGLSVEEKTKWKPLYEAVSAGVGPSTFAWQVMEDTNKLKQLLPGVPEDALPVGASLARQTADLEESLRDEFKLDQLSSNLSKLQSRGITIEDDLTGYITTRDKYIEKLDKMISSAQDTSINMDMANPYVAKRMNNYTNYLYLMKGRQQKRYTDMLNSSIDYYNQELTNANDAYKTAYSAFTNALISGKEIVKEDYDRLKTMLEEMYSNIEGREELELKKQKLREEVEQAQYSTIADAAKAGIKINPDGTKEKLEETSPFTKAKEIIAANPNDTDAELRVKLLGDPSLKLTVTDINSLLEIREKPESFTEEWFKSKIKTARASDYSDQEIIDFILDKYDKEELFQAAKKAGYAKWYSGSDADVERYIRSLL